MSKRCKNVAGQNSDYSNNLLAKRNDSQFPQKKEAQRVLLHYALECSCCTSQILNSELLNKFRPSGADDDHRDK